jgi:NAD-dependent dihydropyrimidine dehydrogenase PreA subunit
MTEYKYIKNGETLKLDASACEGCGECVEVCPHGVFELSEGKAGIRDRELCMECGACARNCPASAIAVTTGVGCAAAIIIGKLTGSTPSCSCGSGSGKPCCG